MALGGGVWTTQNKVLPGAYIQFISAARASSTIGERGYAALPIELDWGIDGEVMTLEAGDIQKNSIKLFGYDYTSEKLNGIKDLFKNAKIGYLYRLNSGDKASNTYAEAKYSGIRGNDLSIVIATNIDDPTKFDVITYLEGMKVDEQTVTDATELVDNDFVTFISTATLQVEAGVPLENGTNGTVTGAEYQTFLDKIESYTFNTLACPTDDDAIKELFVQFTKRMRDDVGVKFQTVVHKYEADFEGVIHVDNNVDDVAALIAWVTGASAGCEINRSNTNKVYDGYCKINTSYTQEQLKACIKEGKFVFHQCGDDVRVLVDVNSFVSATVDKNDDFKENQVIRILDQIGNDIAVLFNTRFLGKVQNNEAGRVSFWNEVDNYNKQLEKIQAIENYDPRELKVEKGDTKTSVVCENPITPVCCMNKLYMRVVIL